MKRLHKTAVYPYPPETVWVALTDPHALAEWLMPNDFKPQLGHEFTFRTDPAPGCGEGLTICKVLEIDPPWTLTLSWQHGPTKKSREFPPMRVEFSLTPVGEGTRLELVQTGLEGQKWLMPYMMNFGWGMMLKKLTPKVLAGISVVEGVPEFSPGAIPLAKRCYKVKTVPETHTF